MATVAAIALVGKAVRIPSTRFAGIQLPPRREHFV